MLPSLTAYAPWNGVALPMANGESIIDRSGAMLDGHAMGDLAEPGTFACTWHRLRRLGWRR